MVIDLTLSNGEPYLVEDHRAVGHILSGSLYTAIADLKYIMSLVENNGFKVINIFTSWFTFRLLIEMQQEIVQKTKQPLAYIDAQDPSHLYILGINVGCMNDLHFGFVECVGSINA